MNHMVIGLGEVGQAVFDVLRAHDDYAVGWQDVSDRHVPYKGRTHVMHVAIPYSKSFEYIVRGYIGTYAPELVIVHATVPIGTCDSNEWVHSPVRGVHPNIAQGIRTFVKYFGGKRSEQAADVFGALGIKVVAVPHARDCEAAKLWDTTQYGVQIVLMKAIYAWCKERGVDFELVYREFNRTYNQGYAALGRPEVARPYLKHVPGPIGGHCVIPNLPLLGENEVTALVRTFNDMLIAEDLAVAGDLP